jgi:putative transposase
MAWFNSHRLLETVGYIPPAEAEANYNQALKTSTSESQLT